MSSSGTVLLGWSLASSFGGLKSIRLVAAGTLARFLAALGARRRLVLIWILAAFLRLDRGGKARQDRLPAEKQIAAYLYCNRTTGVGRQPSARRNPRLPF